LNKGEAAHKLKRAVFFHERGEIRDRSFESQAFRASGLNLVVSAIVHWNTVYLSRAVQHLRQKRRIIPNDMLKDVSPLSWEHINLTGIYTWDEPPSFADSGFRPLRTSTANSASSLRFIIRSRLPYDFEQFLFRPPFAAAALGQLR